MGNTDKIKSSILAVLEYLDDGVRMHVPASGFVVVKGEIIKAQLAINNVNRNNIAKTYAESLRSIYESAMKNGATTLFFKQATEISIDGELSEVVQAQIAARIALAYYLEKIIDTADYADVQAFRERAEDLKFNAVETIEAIKASDLRFRKRGKVSLCEPMSKSILIDREQTVIEKIDKMILIVGSKANYEPTHVHEGTHHALVASYQIFGNVSKAYEIVKWSGAVSGAVISQPTYYREKNES